MVSDKGFKVVCVCVCRGINHLQPVGVIMAIEVLEEMPWQHISVVMFQPEPRAK
jgi:hypothetical protein